MTLSGLEEFQIHDETDTNSNDTLAVAKVPCSPHGYHRSDALVSVEDEGLSSHDSYDQRLDNFGRAIVLSSGNLTSCANMPSSSENSSGQGSEGPLFSVPGDPEPWTLGSAFAFAVDKEAMDREAVEENALIVYTT
jgi:hypothetical protein